MHKRQPRATELFDVVQWKERQLTIQKDKERWCKKISKK